MNIWSIQINLEFHDLEMFHHSWLKRIITGIKRQKEAKKRWKRWPITRNVLLKLFNHFDQNIQKNSTWHVFYCFVFAAFLRIEKFIYLKQDLKNFVFEMWHFIRQFVILQKDKLTLFLFTSKTDFFKKNVTLFIIIANDKTCVMILLKHLFINFFTNLNFFYFKHSWNFRSFTTFLLTKSKNFITTQLSKQFFKIFIQKKCRNFCQNNEIIKQ